DIGVFACCFLFIFQAEDGIRDRNVTGVQTCALPIYDAGYHTAYFGKWHLDGFNEAEGRAAMHIVPPERRGGFQTWVGYENNNSQIGRASCRERVTRSVDAVS